MSRILISHSYFLRFDSKQWDQQQPYAPLGTLIAAAVLRNLGHEVYFHDTMFDYSTQEIKSKLKVLKPDFFILYDDGFNYLTKMCLTNMREAAFDMMNYASGLKIKVIVNSSDSSDRYELYLKNGAHIVIAGEGEETLAELIQEWHEKTSIPQIEGCIFLENISIKKTPPRQVMRELDKLPFAAWDLLDIQPYKNAWMKSNKFFSMNMYTTRGCPYHCNWCAKPIYGNRYNARSPKNVVEELKMMKTIFNFDHIWFCDDIFGLKPGWVNQFAVDLKAAGLILKYKIQSRADLLLKENTVEALALSGCDEVWMGAESGSQKILDAMDKGITIEQIKIASITLKKSKIKPCFFIQFGYLGEDLNDINRTIDMVLDLMPHDIGVSVSYPLPGTKFHDRVKDELKLKTNWNDSDELALMFKNTFPSSFYKDLHRYLHKKYRSKQALTELKNIHSNPKDLSQLKIKKVSSYLYHRPAAWYFKKRLQRYTKISID
jgi:radical SAM superfamily enzyme YgiQ (UPF0313 family)